MNRLGNATSPYLLQHADNPVDWWPWSDEAFAEARRLDVPVLLSVGYAACHWCHVMAHESFEDETTAALVNANLIAIKVDREERPDIDAVYMSATQAMTGQGGWPMTVFMTPDGDPFLCGTYYPRERFIQLVTAVADAWKKNKGQIQTESHARHISIIQKIFIGCGSGRECRMRCGTAAIKLVKKDGKIFLRDASAVVLYSNGNNIRFFNCGNRYQTTIRGVFDRILDQI